MAGLIKADLAYLATHLWLWIPKASTLNIKFLLDFWRIWACHLTTSISIPGNGPPKVGQAPEWTCLSQLLTLVSSAFGCNLVPFLSPSWPRQAENHIFQLVKSQGPPGTYWAVASLWSIYWAVSCICCQLVTQLGNGGCRSASAEITPLSSVCLS